MQWLISENQIVGIPDPNITYPSGFEVVEGVEAIDRSLVYFNGTAVVFKPEKPSPGAVWNPVDNEWIEPESPPVLPNWAGLENELRGSDVWLKAFTAADETVKAQNRFTLLMSTIATTHNLNDLKFAFNGLRQAMAEIPSVGDFTESELNWIGEILLDNDFDPDDFNLD